MSTEKSIDVLSTELQGVKEQLAELKGLFTNFQSNFIRSDIYTVRHEELVTKIAKLEKDSVHFENLCSTIQVDMNKAKGALITLKLIIGALTGIAAILGAVWWVKG